MAFEHVKEGDVVTRMLAGVVPLLLKVTEVDDEYIYCGERGVGWKFDRKRGLEVDEDISCLVSYLVKDKSNNEHQ